MNITRNILMIFLIANGLSLHAMEDNTAKNDLLAAEEISAICNRFKHLVAEDVTRENVTALNQLLETTLSLDMPTIKAVYEQLKNEPYFFQAVQNSNGQAVKFLLTVANSAVRDDREFLEFIHLYHGNKAQPQPANEMLQIVAQNKNIKIIKLIIQFLELRCRLETTGLCLNQCYAVKTQSLLIAETIHNVNNNDMPLIKFLIPRMSYNHISLLSCTAERENSDDIKKLVSWLENTPMDEFLGKITPSVIRYMGTVPSLKKLCSKALLAQKINLRNLSIPAELERFAAKSPEKDVNTLINAYIHGNRELCKYLIAQGADIHIRSKFGLSYAEIVDRWEKQAL